jgi:metallo-beta-lactamase class B
VAVTTERRNGLLISVITLLFAAAAGAQQAVTADAHVDAAKTFAGDDLSVPFEFFCVPGNARPNNFSAPALTPVQLFDNLYAVGNSETVVYALTTSEGIVLIDAGHPGDIETVVLPGLVALGLDPAAIKYVLIAHGHSDHYGGAAFLQEKGATIGATAADWDTMAAEAPSARFGEIPKPKPDLVLQEGTALVVGDTTIKLVEIPGHTPGSLAFIFPVHDGADNHVAGLFGGTVLAPGFTPLPGLRQYITSIAHYLDTARQMQVDVEIQNHPIFDDTPARFEALAKRAPGAAHPFVMGNERYVRFWNVVSECMQAALVQREAAQ